MRVLTCSFVVALSIAVPARAQDAPPPRATPIGNPGAWIPPNSYPPAARASAEEGRVSFTLMIDSSGTVNDCKVTGTSESPLLDETTCNLMIANGRFTPPRDKKNKPVASEWKSSVRWKLDPVPVAPASAVALGTPSRAIGDPGAWFPMSAYPGAARKRHEQGRVVVRLTLDQVGHPTACTVVSTSGSAILDEATCRLAVRNGRFVPALDAKGIAQPSMYTLPAVNWAL